MAKRNYDDWLKAFVDYASFGEAPLKMLWWTGVSTVAGALRRRVWIDQKYFQWVPNFYIIMVAPPGVVAKSTTANIGMNLLRPLKEIKFGPDVITWQELISSLGKSTTGEITPETGEIYPMSAVTFCSDELGNLLKTSDRDLIDALVALWDGKRGVFSKETKTSGKDKIENPFVNIIGCTTPSWMADNFSAYMLGGGLAARIVFVHADTKRQLVPYVDEVVPPHFEEMKRKLTEDLDTISKMFGEFEITQSARTWGRAWYTHHWTQKPQNLSGEQFAAYLSRKQTHIHKLGMVLSASQGSSLRIEAPHLEASESFCAAIEADMPKVFSRVGQTAVTSASVHIIQMVERRPGIPQSELFVSLMTTLTYTQFIEALNGAVNSLQIRPMQKGNDLSYYPAEKPKEAANE